MSQESVVEEGVRWEQVEAEAEQALRARDAADFDVAYPNRIRYEFLARYISEHHPAWAAKMRHPPGYSFHVSPIYLSLTIIEEVRVPWRRSERDIIQTIHEMFANLSHSNPWFDPGMYDYVRRRIPPHLLRAAAMAPLSPYKAEHVRRELLVGFRDLHVLDQSNATAKFAHTQGPHIANLIGQFLSMHVTPSAPVPQRAMVQRWVPAPDGKRRMHDPEAKDSKKDPRRE